jgi:hypothetical protein
MEVDWQSAEARYEDGLLRIRFNKPEQAKPIRIPLNSVQDASVISTVEAPRIEGKQKAGKS